MTTLKERLERRIEKDADSAYRNWCQGDTPNKPVFQGFIEGANSLVPLILELAGVIEYYHSAQCTWIDGSLNVGPAKKALQAIDGFLVDEK